MSAFDLSLCRWYVICELEDDDFPAHPAELVLGLQTNAWLRRAEWKKVSANLTDIDDVRPFRTCSSIRLTKVTVRSLKKAFSKDRTRELAHAHVVGYVLHWKL